jgi:predicted amidohydrolase YtcJ
MINRRYPGRPELGGLNPDQRLDRETVIEIFTRNGAIALAKEDETGKSADFIVIEQNILEVPVEKIRNTKVLKTVLQGHTVCQYK